MENTKEYKIYGFLVCVCLFLFYSQIMNAILSNCRSAGYTLVETLIVVCLLGIFPWTMYTIVGHTVASTAEIKLQQDVGALNRAVRLYLTGGGSLPKRVNPEQVLGILKTKAINGEEIASLRGSMIDPRITAVTEFRNEEKAAFWDDASSTFLVANRTQVPRGVSAVSRFDLADTVVAPASSETRQTAFKLNREDNWIWSYRDNDPPARPAGPNQRLSAQGGGGYVPSAQSVTLLPPSFSLPSGTHPLSTYPSPLALVNPNPAGVSLIRFSKNDAAWTIFTSPLEVLPSDTITAYAESTDTNGYEDSDLSNAAYAVDALSLKAGDNLLNFYNYGDLGGALAFGSVVSMPASPHGLELLNADELPDYWENHGIFQMFWSLDGSDPRNETPARHAGDDAFNIHYPGDPIPISFSDFSGLTPLTVHYYAKAKNSVVISSPIREKVIAQATVRLLPPIITPEGDTLDGTEPIHLSLDLTGGQTPAGARIYYRLDGRDPGSGADPEAGATEYLRPFLPPADSGMSVSVTAQVYPPSNFKPWFTTSQPTNHQYVLGFADQNFFGVLGNDRGIYRVDPRTGKNQLINASAPFNLRTLALDSAHAMIYYTEQNASTTWRLGRWDLLNNTHTVLGTLSGGKAYNFTKQPENLVFYNGSLYCIHENTDDLIRITLSGNQIGTVTKIADIQNDAGTFARVGDLVVDASGWLHFNSQDKRYYRFNLTTLSEFKLTGSTERDNDALALYHNALYGGDGGSDEIRSLDLTNGGTITKVKTIPSRNFADFAGPTPPSSDPHSSTLWMIVDTPPGPHLHKITNYRNALIASDLDYGLIYYLDGNKPKSLEAGHQSYISSMCISSSGTLFFARNFKTPVAGKDYLRPVFQLDVGSLAAGDALKANFVGDLTTGLASIVGSIDPDDMVTGLTLAPGGSLVGVLREGADSGSGAEDLLFRFSLPMAGATSRNLPVTTIGKLTSSLASSTRTEDLTFAPNGELFAVDTYDEQVYRVNPLNGSILDVFSAEPNSNYHALAVDPADYRLIGCNASGPQANRLMRINGGSNNDSPFIDLQSLFGISQIEAMAFFQGSFTISSTSADIYAVDGTETIYGIDCDTGSAIPFTDAPFPLRTLAYDYRNRRLFYMKNSASQMTLGSFSLVDNTHAISGELLNPTLEYRPIENPDNLCYFGGFLWYVPPHTDDLVQIQLTSSGTLQAQAKKADLTGNRLQFDLIGDLAIAPDGWMYFSAVNHDGLWFCRYGIASQSSFEVISGPTAFTLNPSGVPQYRENWLDALSFRPTNALGNRPLYGSRSACPTLLRNVDPVTGSSVLFKPLVPTIQVIDFSDYHPGDLGTLSTLATPVLAFADLRAGYTYADIGGAFVPGIVPAPLPTPPPSVVLANPNEIPLSLQSSNTFTIHWSYNSENPLTTASATNGPAFSGGMPAMGVSVDLTKWGQRSILPITVAAKSRQPSVAQDSAALVAKLPIVKTQLRVPQLVELTDASGQTKVQITSAIDAGDCPPGTRIYYTTNGTDSGVVTDTTGLDNPVSGTLYTGPIPVPSTGITNYLVTARVYPPSSLAIWFSASITDYLDVPLGLAGGHMDVDTSHLLYPFRQGTTDGHVHEYDKKYNVVGDSFFAFKTTTLKNIPIYVLNGVKFKIIIANADLSTGGRLAINKDYNSLDSSTYIPVRTYDNTPLASLPVYSLDGVLGTTKLTQLGLYFDSAVIGSGGLLGTVTGAVRSNTPGKNGEWRNGALTVQLVKVNADGTDAFQTDTSLSAGGVQGVAKSGLLWETTFFWHHPGAAYGL